MLSPPSLSRDSSTPLPHRVLGRWIHEHFWGKEAEECLIDRRHNENPKCFGHLEHLTIVTRWGKQGKSSAAAAASLRAQGGRDLRRDSYTDSILWAKVLPKYADTFSFIKEAPGWLTGAEKSSPILSGTPRGHDVRSKGNAVWLTWETGNESSPRIWGRDGRASPVPTSSLGTAAAQSMARLQALLTGTGAETGKKNEHLKVHMNKLMPQGCQSCANTLS